MAYFLVMRKADRVYVTLRVSQSDLINANTGGISAALPAWYLENIKVDPNPLTNSEISVVKVFQYQNNSNEKTVYLTLRLLVTYDKKSGIYTYNGLPLLVGSYQSFTYNGVLIRGIVQNVSGVMEDKREEKTLMVEGLVKVENYMTKNFVNGLTISDSDDRVVAKIENVEIDPGDSKDNKIVKLKLRIRVDKFDDVYLYGGETAIKMGQELDLDFWNFEAKVTVTDFKEVLE